jgi:uncharacterized protein (UPF0548 family)
MQIWRFGRGWSEASLKRHLAELAQRKVSFTTLAEQMTQAAGWYVDGIDAPIGREPPGRPLPDGLFARARSAVINYDFSDPRIVVGHFDPDAPLAGRDILLEIKVFGLRFLNGARVHSVRDEADDARTVFGYRYDTLTGHFEQGFEWFLLTKTHATGEVRFKIEARWRLDKFPNWWSRLGFLLVGERFRELWRRLAVKRLRRLARRPADRAIAGPGRLAHRGDTTPSRSR